MRYYTVFAGVNGAGKSTMYRSHKGLKEEKRINADEIIRELKMDWRDQKAQYEAGRVALERIDEYLGQKISFNQETTLASKNAIKNAIRAKSLGYTTEMHYVCVDSVDIAIDRIKNRVADGGHGIPDDIVRRRYDKSLKNFTQAIPVFNTIFVYDNTSIYRTVATFINGEMISVVDNAPRWFMKIINMDRMI